MEKDKRFKLCFLISVVLVFFSGGMAAAFQNNFGTIDVQEVAIARQDGSLLVGKLFRPIGVNELNTAPGVLGLHGYNNDKDIHRGTAIELARAGMVVLLIDQLGHGDSEGPGSFDTPSCDAAYKWLESLPFVNGSTVKDDKQIGIFGHSMGYIEAWLTAMSNPSHDACAFESFPPLLRMPFHHNVLHTWAEYEEWYTVDWYSGMGWYTANMTIKQVYEQGLAMIHLNALGTGDLTYSGTPEVDETYGDFATGTAYREHFVKGIDHPGLTMDQGCTAEIVAWMLQALSGKSEADAWSIAAIAGQTYLGAEIFGGLALLFSFVSVIFLSLLLLKTKFFAEVKQPMPERVVTKDKKRWWIFAAANTVIAALFFGLFTHADVHWSIDDSGSWGAPWNMGMINNWLGFFITTAACAAFLVSLWYILSNRKERGSITLYDLGVTYDNEKFAITIKNKAHWQIFGKTALLSITLFGWMYLLVSIFQTFFLIEFRIFWAFAKMFTPERFLMFLLYLPLFIPFFLINGGVFLFGQVRPEESSTSVKTYLVWGAKALFTMLFGLLLLFLIQYIGVTVSNYPYEGWWFNPIMPIQLMMALPFYTVLYLMMIFFYRKTGKIYLGSFFGAIMTVWFLSVGTAMAVGL